MPEYTANEIQTVAVGANVLFTETAVPCNSGYVIHREGAGAITLRGICKNSCAKTARYLVEFGANIAVPAGEGVTPISVALQVNGDVIPTSTAIVTPAATDAYFNVSRSTFIEVPCGCCVTISLRNTSTTSINAQNSNIIITRVS